MATSQGLTASGIHMVIIHVKQLNIYIYIPMKSTLFSCVCDEDSDSDNSIYNKYFI